MKIAVIIERSAPHRKRITHNLASIQRHQIQTFTSNSEDCKNTVTQALQALPDLVMICGGLSLSTCVINLLQDLRLDSKPVLSIHSAGTTNDFCKTYDNGGVTRTINQFEKGKLYPLDLIKITGPFKHRYALNMVTCGLGGNILRSVKNKERWLPESLNYHLSIMYWLLKYKSPKLRISVNSMTIKNHLFMAGFGNGKFAGNGLGICPQAELGNGSFAVTLIGKIGLFDFFKYYAKLRKAKLISKDPRGVYTSSHSTELEVLEGEMAIECDGQYFRSFEAGERLNIHSIPSAFSVVQN
ncbi:MAG: diacylglycerol kinase family protein [Flavobacteriales bacterium]